MPKLAQPGHAAPVRLNYLGLLTGCRGCSTMSARLGRLSFAGGTLVLEGLPPEAVRQAFVPQPWVWDQRVGAWRCDALEYDAVRRSLLLTGCRFTDMVPVWGQV